MAGWLNFMFTLASMVAIAFGVAKILVQYMNANMHQIVIGSE